MIASADVVMRLYGLLTEAVRWQNETCSSPGPALVAGLAGVANAVVVVGAAVVVAVVVGGVVGAAVVGEADVAGGVAVVVGGAVGAEVVGLVVVCAPAGRPASNRARSAQMPIPRSETRCT
jgi:hypothetical protein